MTVRMYVCPVHGPVPSKVLAGDEIPRCPSCAAPLDERVLGPDPDPRTKRPPRGQADPL